MRFILVTAFATTIALSTGTTANAGMSLFQFSYKNTSGGPAAPYGTLTVLEGFNLTENVDTLTFTIDLDESKLGAAVDIHQFGFQLDFTGTPDLVPKPQTVGSGANTFNLTALGVMDSLAGFGSNTEWDYMVDFGSGANPTLDPVSFTIGATGLTLAALNFNDLALKNVHNASQGTESNFAVHAQSTGTGDDSEGLGGFYRPELVGAVTPELNSFYTAIAAVIAAMCLPLLRGVVRKCCC